MLVWLVLIPSLSIDFRIIEGLILPEYRINFTDVETIEISEDLGDDLFDPNDEMIKPKDIDQLHVDQIPDLAKLHK